MIRAGDISVGLSTVDAFEKTLPPDFSGRSVEEQIDFLVDKLSEVQVVLEGKADSNKLKTLIAYSDDALLIQAENIALVGEVTIAQIVREQNGSASPTLPASITRIIGDRVQTGRIISNNWSASEGTAIDLDESKIWMGGSDNPALYYDGAGNLEILGTLKAGAIISKSITISDYSGSPTVEDVIDTANGALPASSFGASLDSALSSGVASIVAGFGDDFILDVGSSAVLAQHKDANVDGLGSGYSGTLRTALAVNANGIAMGYNSKTTGAFVPSIVLDGTTGDVTMTGTLTAGSVITGSVTVDGTQLSTVRTNAATGSTHAGTSGNPHNTLLTEVSGDLDDIADGSTYFRTTANDVAGAERGYNALDSSYNYVRGLSTQRIIVSESNPTNGVVIDSNGLRGYGGGVIKFNISTTGDVSMTGTLTAGSVITGSVTVDGVQLSTVSSNAATGSSHAGTTGNPHSTSLAQVSGDLDDIADGSTYFRTTSTQVTGADRAANALDSSFDYIRAISTTKIAVSGTNPTNGVVIDSSGLRGYSGGVQKFNIDTSGNVSFSGDISGANGTFTGSIVTGGQIKSTGSVASTEGNFSIVGQPSTGSIGGVLGISVSSTGVAGVSTNGVGVLARSSSSTQGAIECSNLSGGPAISSVGSVRMTTVSGNVTIGPVTETGQNNLIIKEGVSGSRIAGQVALYGQSDSGNAVIGVLTENTVTAGTGAFTGISQIKVYWNNTAYWLPLQAA